MKKLIAGNWKMNLSAIEAETLLYELRKVLPASANGTREYLICPSCIYLERATEILSDSAVHVGGQDCSVSDNGAHTGDISARMLKGIGCHYVILGHSERRAEDQETSARVSEKAARAHDQGLITIICVGETEDERAKGLQEDIVWRQLEESFPSQVTAQNTVVAYEPVWAIGTGQAATPDDVKTMHAFIRRKLKEKLADADEIRILYGGSVKPENADELLGIENVDGFLIGGASLKAESFEAIAHTGVYPG